MIGGPGEGKTSRSFLESFLHFLYFLPVYVASTYFLLEILLPKYIYKRRWVSFIVSFLFLFFLTYTGIYYCGVIYLHYTNNVPFEQVDFNANKYHAIADGLFVPFMLFGIAAGIKFSKKWFIQQRQNEKLSKQKLATELQLLKTSVHPRFLFHSLRTVEKHINDSSADAPVLILQLSDLLSYILYENEDDWAPLKKELEIIRSYINLEEKSFGDTLTLRTEFPQNLQDTFIVSCILLSFVEAIFEYFLEGAQEEPSLDLTIRIYENVLHYQSIFSKDEGNNLVRLCEKFKHIEKQLHSQYVDFHQFNMSADNDTILIDLKLPLYSEDLITLKLNAMLHEVPVLV
jgi:sensor histidine kinase YesM